MVCRFFITIMLVLFFIGCSQQAQGPAFVAHPEIDKDKALVYIYRKGNESGGYDRIYSLKANSKDITVLRHGGYFPYIAEAGKITFVSDVIATLPMFVVPVASAIEAVNNEGAAIQELTVEAGKTYYLQFYPIEHFTYFELKFKVSDSITGENDLKECKLLEAKILNN